MEMSAFRLPDGRIVQIDESTVRGSDVCSFTLEGGAIVEAVRVQDVFVLSYRWLDLQPVAVPITHDLFFTELEARIEMGRLAADEKTRKPFDPESEGQFEITIARYVFAQHVARKVV